MKPLINRFCLPFLMILPFMVAHSMAQDILDETGNTIKADSSFLKAPDVQVEAGFIGTFSGNGTYQYMRPSLQFPVSDQLTLSGGLLIGRGNLYNTYRGPATGLQQRQVQLDLAGAYQVTSQLTFEGAASFPLTSASNSNREGSYGLTPQQERAFRFEAAYSVSDKMTIEAGFQYREGRYPIGRPNNFFHPQRPALNGGFGGFDQRWGNSPW